MTTLIVHSHQLDKNGEPSIEFQARLTEGMELYIKGKIHEILLSGGMASRGIPLMHSDVAKKWVLSKSGSIPIDNIHTEITGSQDTIGEVIFARKEHGSDILAPKEKIVLLSSDYHLQRLEIIANHVFGKRSLDFIGISGFSRSNGAEERSLQSYFTTFAGTPEGDLPKFEETLWKKHGLYRDHPKNPYYKKS